MQIDSTFVWDSTDIDFMMSAISWMVNSPHGVCDPIEADSSKESVDLQWITNIMKSLSNGTPTKMDSSFIGS
jgi:hypothetical protein